MSLSVKIVENRHISLAIYARPSICTDKMYLLLRTTEFIDQRYRPEITMARVSSLGKRNRLQTVTASRYS